MELEGTDSEKKFKEAFYREAAAVASIYDGERRSLDIVKKEEPEKTLFEKPTGKVRRIFWQRPVMKTDKQPTKTSDVDEVIRQIRELGVDDYSEGKTDDVIIRDPPAPKSRLLVLDLNGIFTHRTYDKRKEIDDVTATRLGNFMVWSRPHTHEFFTFIFEHFEVGIWSSVTRQNIEPLAKLVFGKFFNDLLFIADQEFCQAIPSDDHGAAKPIFLKNLDDLWVSFPQFNRFNTLIVDDSDEKMVNNPVECHFNPGTWKGLMSDHDLSAKNGRIYAHVLNYVNRSAGLVEALHTERPKLKFEPSKVESCPEKAPSPIRELLESTGDSF